MKGVVFTTFLEMVETTWDFDMVDSIIEKSDLKSGGSYTSVGTYDHQEAIALVSALSEATGLGIDNLLKSFGKHLFQVLISGHPEFAAGVEHPLDFLEGVERYIHVEVRKLYPDAELPRFDCKRQSDNQLVMIYSSARHLEDLCEGLIEGCLEFYQCTGTIARASLPNEKEEFTISLESTS